MLVLWEQLVTETTQCRGWSGSYCPIGSLGSGFQDGKQVDVLFSELRFRFAPTCAGLTYFMLALTLNS